MKALKNGFLILGCILLLLGYYIDIIEAQTDVGEDVKTFLINLEDAVDKMDTYRFITLSENWKGKKHEKKLIR